jgi:hypothetical protein
MWIDKIEKHAHKNSSQKYFRLKDTKLAKSSAKGQKYNSKLNTILSLFMILSILYLLNESMFGLELFLCPCFSTSSIHMSGFKFF